MNARDLAAATPTSRDRYVDLLRVVSIAVVVVGHWLMAVPVEIGGEIKGGNALAGHDRLHYLTWLFQVMPLFFLVGGFANYTALRNGPTYSDFVRGRMRRLLAPTLVFVSVWTGVAVAADQVWGQQGIWKVASRTVAQPLWFLGVYLAVIALAPVMMRLHRRYAWRVPVALGAAVVAVDVARFHYGIATIGMLNLVFLWVLVHQLGYLYADGTLLGPRIREFMAVGGLASVVLLTTTGLYPVSMVGMPGAEVSNMAPPTMALLAHALWLTGAALLLRDRVNRLLARPRVWTGVVAANGVVMTVFLWHLTSVFALYAALLHFGVTLPEPLSAAWWATRVPFLAVLVLVTAFLVNVFRNAERVEGAPKVPGPSWHAAVAAVAGIIGILGISAVGFGGVLDGRTASLLGVPMSLPVAAVLLIGAAAFAQPERAAKRMSARVG